MVLENLRAAPRAFKVLITSALIENMAFGLIIPFLTIYMVRDIEISESLAGVVLAGYTLSGIPGMIFGGMLVDKIGRRAVLLTSLGLMSLTIFLYFFAFDFVTFLLVAMADSFVGSLYMPAANAVIADVIPSRDRPKAYSTLRIAWNVGLIFGPAAGAAIVVAYSIKVLFLFGAVILLGAFFMNLVFIPETKPKDTGEAVTFGKVVAVARDRPFLMICSMSAVLFLCMTQFMSALPIYMVADMDKDESSVGLLWTLSGLMIVFLQLWVTSQMVKFRRSAVLMSGQIVMGIGIALIYLATDLLTLSACVIVMTIGELMYMSILGAIVADMAPEERRGIYMGFSGFMQTLGWGVGMFLGLWMLDVLPQRDTMWLIFGTIAIATSIAYLTFGRMIGPVKDQPGKHDATGMEPLLGD
ncbi:MAG: MFS transporter [Candidatus Thermoplasmatota archaeon]|nr:MFS transporter [Candidatus Thermoplasmatota archaeon]